VAGDALDGVEMLQSWKVGALHGLLPSTTREWENSIMRILFIVQQIDYEPQGSCNSPQL